MISTTSIPWDFDNRPTWEPEVSRILIQHLGADYKEQLRRWGQNPENYYGEERFMLSLSNHNCVYSDLLKWIGRKNMFAYHGSRLTEKQIKSVQTHGLRSLILNDQIEIIQEKMKDYCDWSVSDHELAEKISNFRSNGAEGNREGRVSFLMSKNSLLKLHYVREGSEFCSRIVCDLAGKQGRIHLKTKGIPVVFKVEIPANEVLTGFRVSNTPPPDTLRRDQDFPAPLMSLVSAHAQNILNSKDGHYQNIELKFSKDIPSNWIVKTLFPTI